MSDDNEKQQALLAELEKLKFENEQLRARVGKTVYFKVSPKGGVSMYGVTIRWPLTLYKDQWARLIENIEPLKAFLAENDAALKTKS